MDSLWKEMPGIIERELMLTMDSIKPGLTAQKVVTVDRSLSVTHTKTPVLSTPMMISLIGKRLY